MDPLASRAEMYKTMIDVSVDRAVGNATADELELRTQARNGQSDQNYRGAFLGQKSGLFRMGNGLSE